MEGTLVAAMAVVIFSGEALRRLRHVFEDRLQFEATISLGGCLCCSPSTRLEGKPWKSGLGQREYEMSGLCEECFDFLFHEGDIEATPTGLAPQRAELLLFGVLVRKAQGAICMPSGMAKIMNALLCALQISLEMGA